MPGRLLGLLNSTAIGIGGHSNGGDGNGHGNSTQLKSLLNNSNRSRNASSTSISVEHPTSRESTSVLAAAKQKFTIKPVTNKDHNNQNNNIIAKKETSSQKPSAPRRQSSAMDALKRRSLHGSSSSGSGHGGRHNSADAKSHKKSSDGKSSAGADASRAAEALAGARLSIREETPPLLLIGIASAPDAPREDDQPSALLSTKISLDVLVPSVTLTSWETRLVCVVKHLHPVEKHCSDCITKVTELRRWRHMPEGAVQQVWKKGSHDIPLQYLFENHLPASVTVPSSMATVGYQIETVAKTGQGAEIKKIHPVVLKRAIIPGNDKHSVRVFPPTSVVVNVNLQPVVHPIGEIPLNMVMSGVFEHKRDSVRRWRLRKLAWRIEESSRMVSPACSRHAAKVGGEGKGITHEDMRSIGQGELKDGWKADWDKGEVVCEFKAAVNPNAHPVCDVNAQNGFKVTHALILELVVAEEWAPRHRPHAMTPTGAARILKTQFTLVLTERMGMGIAWDHEMPPLYDDVPPAPPLYPVREYEVPPSPPHYRRGSVGSLDHVSLRELDIVAHDLGDLSLRRDTPLDRERTAASSRGLTAADLETEEPRAGPSSRRHDGDPSETTVDEDRDEAVGSLS